MEALLKLKKDIKNASINLSDEEARYLVDTYYQMQEYRKATNNQCRTLKPHLKVNRTTHWGSLLITFKRLKTTLNPALKPM